MMNRQIRLAIIIVGLALGTAWAVRGKFGHEQGAAWAGAIGAFSLILVARRKDWYPRTFKILMASAFGWGISGMMSYGMIVGYGKATDFVNAFYGLLMLFVVGFLYGFLGGGFFGLGLLDSKTLKVKWHSLVTEMVAIGLLVYGLLVNQLEWLMTPPRSELWAAAFGASIALAWFITRNRFENVMKVALWSAFGAGFGFAFGNFLQVIGNSSGIDLNFWNVMEYSIGFFGGIGMAYGTLTSSWPLSEATTFQPFEVVSTLFVTLFVPFVVWEQSFVNDRFVFISEAGGPTLMVFYIKLIALISILTLPAMAFKGKYDSAKQLNDHYRPLRNFFIVYLMVYIFLSFLVTGLFIHPPEQYLYLFNLVVIIFLLSRASGHFHVSGERPRKWLALAGFAIAVIALLAIIAINSHGTLDGVNRRFETKGMQ